MSTDVDPSLLKYTTFLREPDGQLKNQIDLNTIIHSIFFDSNTGQARPWQKVRIIDLGCRKLCDGFGAMAGVIDSATIDALEAAAVIAGKKRKRTRRKSKSQRR